VPHELLLLLAQASLILPSLLVAYPVTVAQRLRASLFNLLQTAQRASLWRGMLRNALKAVQTASFGGYKASLEAGG
jgi:hypothetical protein